MKENYQEEIKQKTEKELEIIAKDIVFYSEEERLIALNELAARGKLSRELSETKDDLEFEKEAKKPAHRIQLKDLLPQKNYLFTPVLIYANIFVFLVMVLFGMNVFTPNTNTLVQWGGNIRQLTINGQFWRLFTCK